MVYVAYAVYMLRDIRWCGCLVGSYFDPEECLYMSTREDEADETR